MDKKAKTVDQFVNEYVDRLKENDTFNARKIARAYRDYLLGMGLPPRLPYSDTIQRSLRSRRASVGDVFYFDYGRSIWWKNDHVATKEERCSHKGR